MSRWLLSTSKNGDSATSGQPVLVLWHTHSKSVFPFFFFFKVFPVVALPFPSALKPSGQGELGTNAACKALARFCKPIRAPNNPLAPVSAARSSTSLTKANPGDPLCRRSSKRLSQMTLQGTAVGQPERGINTWRSSI